MTIINGLKGIEVSFSGAGAAARGTISSSFVTLLVRDDQALNQWKLEFLPSRLLDHNGISHGASK